MKRHASLVHLSRDHHAALILSRLLQKNAPAYKTLPLDVPGKATYALQFYNEHLVSHFQTEEAIFSITAGASERLDLQTQELTSEHRELTRMFLEIKTQPVTSDALDRIGKFLEAHIRKEEREVFPLIEQACTEKVLAAIEAYISTNK